MSAVSLDSEEVVSAGKCMSVEEVFRPDSRRLVGRVCRQFLDLGFFAASELVSSVELHRRFSGGGTDMQRAVQLVSGAQSRSFQLDLHKRMRVVFKLADTVLEKVAEVEKSVADVPLSPGQGGPAYEAIAGRLGGAKAEMGMCVRMTQALRGIEGWDAKIGALLDYLEAESDPSAAAVVDSFIADILDSPNALKSLFGQASTLGTRLNELIALYKGEWPPEGIEDPSPLLRRLNACMSLHEMECVRKSIDLQMLRNLESGLPVTRSAGIEELLALCSFAEDLRLDEDRLIGGAKVMGAIEQRTGRQVEEENLYSFIDDKASITDTIGKLIQLQSRVVGVGNQKSVGDFIRMQFEKRSFGEKLMASGGGSPSQKLRVVSLLYDVVMDSDLQEGLKERFGVQLEGIQMAYIKKNKVFAKINQQSGSVSETVIRLADLCGAGVFTRGKNLLYVHNLIKHQIGQSGFMKNYLKGVTSDDEKSRMISALKKKLREAGIEKADAA